MSHNRPNPGPPPERGQCPAFDHLVDSTMLALDLPGGDEILERMIEGHMSIGDGIAALAMLSGRYDRIDHEGK